MKTYKEFTNQLYNITEAEDNLYDVFLSRILNHVKNESDSELKELFELMHEQGMKRKYAENKIDRIKAEKEMNKIGMLIRKRYEELTNLDMEKIEKIKNKDVNVDRTKILTILKKIASSSPRWRRMSKSEVGKEIKKIRPISKDKFKVIGK